MAAGPRLPAVYLVGPVLSKICRRLVLLLLCAGTAACDLKTRADAQDPILRIGFGLSAEAYPEGVAVLTSMLYAESLFRKEWDGRLAPHLAETWDWLDDGRRLRLRLKHGVKLHDGSTLTGEMVARQIRARLESDAPSTALQHVTSITSPDERTIELELSEPDFFLLAGLAEFRIVHPDDPEIGTGPFRLLERTPIVRTERFDQYHGGVSALAGVRIITYDTQRAAWTALMRRDVDVVQEITSDAAEFLADNSRINTYSSMQPFYIPFVFNLKHPVLRNPEVRRALSEAIDRQEIITRVMRGKARIATDPVWPLHWANTATNPAPVYDPASARARLDRAGFPARPSPDQPGRNRRFQLRCQVYAENPQYERIAMLLQRQLFEVGIDLVIDLTPILELGENASTGNFETFLLPANAGRTLESTYRFWRSSGPENPEPLVRSGYTGADRLLDRLRRSTSEPEIREAVAGLARQFAADVPAAFLAWPEMTRAIDRRFSTGGEHGRDPFFELWRWHPVDETP